MTLVTSSAIALPHGFLDAAQSDAARFDLVSPLPPVLLTQVHSARALQVTAPFAGAGPEADGMATNRSGTLLAIVTADCAPVLYADAEAGVIGAAHAGWRGAAGGVLEATLGEMIALGAVPERVVAIIGPTIAEASYEVGEDMRDEFVAADHDLFRATAPGKWQFNLPAYVERRLQATGIGRVERTGLDTYALADRFHSYRRATHRGHDRKGRQFSLIALP